MKPIFTSLSPNVEKDDLKLALNLLFSPGGWQKGSSLDALEAYLKGFLETKYTFTFNSGRTGFLAILRALNLEAGSEVLIQGFTCNALVNPLLWSGLNPIFVDIDELTLNLNSADLERKISPKSKAVIVQHTFGLPADLEKITAICQKNNLILIEDCAHSLGATYQGKKIGIFGRAAFFSFGRDKIISSVYGGAVATDDDLLAEKIKKFQDELDFPSNFWIVQQLLHPLLIYFFISPLYRFGDLGKFCLIALQKIGVLSKAVSEKEKRGERPSYFPKKMPNALAALALNQLKKIEKFIAHQKEIASFYKKSFPNNFVLPREQEGRIYLRYSVFSQNKGTDKILKEARKERIFLDDGWRKAVIVPSDTNQEKMGYRAGSCLVSEKVAKNILNLPTHINLSCGSSQRIINFLLSYFPNDR